MEYYAERFNSEQKYELKAVCCWNWNTTISIMNTLSGCPFRWISIDYFLGASWSPSPDAGFSCCIADLRWTWEVLWLLLDVVSFTHYPFPWSILFSILLLYSLLHNWHVISLNVYLTKWKLILLICQGEAIFHSQCVLHHMVAFVILFHDFYSGTYWWKYMYVVLINKDWPFKIKV